MADELPIPPNEQKQPDQTEETTDPAGIPAQTWMWIVVGIIVLLAVSGGVILGFVGGQLVKLVEGDPLEQALLGSLLVESDSIVIFTEINPHGPADTAGIQDGDELISINAERVPSLNEARQVLAGYETGDTINLTIRQSNRTREVSVVLGLYTMVARPTVTLTPFAVIDPPLIHQGQSESARLGILYRMLEPGDPFAVEEGALIVSGPISDTPAQQAGLQTGDIITAVGNTKLSENLDLEDALAGYYEGQKVTLHINRAGETLTLRITF